MTIKYPLEYKLTPREVAAGTRWLTLTLKNVGADDLTALDCRLNSMDAYSLAVHGDGLYVSALRPGQERTLAYRVYAHRTGSLYAHVDGWKDGEGFHWESPPLLVTISTIVAELTRVLAMTEPYPPVGQKIRIEAAVRGLAETEGLDLELWAETPSMDFTQLATIQTKDLSPGEEVEYDAEITPEEEGLHTIYAYLYDGPSRIGRREEHVYVTAA